MLTVSSHSPVLSRDTQTFCKLLHVQFSTIYQCQVQDLVQIINLMKTLEGKQTTENCRLHKTVVVTTYQAWKLQASSDTWCKL